MAIPSIPQQAVCNTANAQVYLTWNQVAGATNYVVQRSPTGLIGSFVTIASPVINNYLDTTVSAGQQYWYYLCSQNASGISSPQTVGTNNLVLQAIPCLPGQISLGYLRYQAKVRTEKLMSNFITDDQWNFFINQSAYRLYDMLVGKYGDDYFFAPPLIINMTVVASHPLPDGVLYSAAPACYKLNGVDLNFGGAISGQNAGWTPCARQNWSDRDKFTFIGQQSTLYNAYQMSYREMGNQLFVFPQNSNTTMRLWYVPQMTQLLKDTDMMPFSISGWSELVIVDVAIKALVQEESYDQANSFVGERTALIERINAIAPNRDVGQPNTVSNTRATMGDPAFNGWGGNGDGFGFGGGF